MREESLPPSQIHSVLAPCACFHARSAARAITGFYDETLAPSGLRMTQFAILASVRVRGSITMQELAAELGLDPSTMTRTLQPLDKAGLVNIEPGEDRRVKELVLTPRGHKRLAEAHGLWLQAQDGLRDRIGGDRFERLVTDLDALTEALRS